MDDTKILHQMDDKMAIFLHDVALFISNYL